MLDFTREISLVRDPSDPDKLGVFYEGDFLSYVRPADGDTTGEHLARNLARCDTPAGTPLEEAVVAYVTEWMSVAEEDSDDDWNPTAVTYYVPEPEAERCPLSERFAEGINEPEQNEEFEREFTRVLACPVK